MAAAVKIFAMVRVASMVAAPGIVSRTYPARRIHYNRMYRVLMQEGMRSSSSQRAPPWRVSRALTGRRMFSLSEPVASHDQLPLINDPRLVKAIAYEFSKSVSNAKGNTTRFSEFLVSQLSSHVMRQELSQNDEILRVLVELSGDAKKYAEMSYAERLELLDRVAQIQGFLSTKDLVSHQAAASEAGRDLSSEELPEKSFPKVIVSPAVVFGSSERINLFKPSRKIVNPSSEPFAEASLTEPRTQPTVRQTRKQQEVRLPVDPLAGKHVESKDERKDDPSVSQQGPQEWKLDTPLSELKFFTFLQRSQLQESGFFTARNLLNYFPRAHITFDSPTDTLEDGQCISMFGTVVDARAMKLRTHLVLLDVIISCNIGQKCFVSTDGSSEQDTKVILHAKRFYYGERFTSYWFLNKLSSYYPKGSKVTVSGKVKTMKMDVGHFEVRDYDLKVVEEGEIDNFKSEGKVYPVYSAKGIFQPMKIKSCIQRLIAGIPNNLDPLPDDIRNKYQLVDLSTAYLGLHSPHSIEEANLARRRFVFDDFFYLQLAFLLKRNGIVSIRESKGLDLESWPSLPLKMLNALPFKLTAGQMKATSEIMWDLRQPVPMSRLLQGDVGCGKTIVAFLVLLDAASSGYQGALMAPTEFVASQHYAQFMSWMSYLDEGDRPKVALLTGGSTTTAAARYVREGLARKEIDIAIGTHALIANSTTFASLGLAVIDEQHRFGVAQRDRLKALHEMSSVTCEEGTCEEGKVKATSGTHVLLMSATPIPRSLALTLHGDMCLSQITDLPPGRQATMTYVLPDDEGGRVKAYEMISLELQAGGKAFIVYSLITESTALCQHAAAVEFENVCRHFSDYKCVLVHGRMKPDARNEEMKKFREGECQILVSTTVIEVGIDIPEASVILVENAETYGVAQLHQLRGRVGRGNRKSTCILLSSCEKSMSRLKLLESTTDGFKLAEADLRMRGPGDLLGKRQAGPHLEFALARIGDDSDILEEARAAAIELVQVTDKNFERLPKLKQEINIRQLPTSWS